MFRRYATRTMAGRRFKLQNWITTIVNLRYYRLGRQSNFRLLSFIPFGSSNKGNQNKRHFTPQGMKVVSARCWATRVSAKFTATNFHIETS